MGTPKRTALPPELTAEWADERAVAKVSVQDPTARWRCRKGHEWTTRISLRLSCPSRPQGSGCPRCHARKRAPLPEWLLEEWHDPRDPDDVPLHAHADWKCSQGHTWRTTIANRMPKSFKPQGSDCPHCVTYKRIRGEIVPIPEELRKEWFDPRPIETVTRQDKTAYWRCDRDHIWQAPITRRLARGLNTRGVGCPHCAGNAKRTELPAHLAAEWADSRPVSQVGALDKTATWMCANKHTWHTTINNRVSAGAGCRKCSSKKRQKPVDTTTL